MVGTAAATAPGIPTSVSITPGNASLSVAFTAPSNGGSAITGYEYSTDGGTSFKSAGTTSSPISITTVSASSSSLLNGTSYNVQIRAINSVGTGSATASVAATPRTVPDAPSITGITPGNASLSVAFNAPASNGGAAITNYEFSTNGGSSFTAASPAVTFSPLLISGLSNGTTYDVQIRAVNAAGSGAASTTTQGTPTAPTLPTLLSSPAVLATGFFTTYGTASSAQSFTVSGSNLDGSAITVTPPAGFEVATSSDFSTTIGTSGTPLNLGTSASISSTVYIRLAATTTAGTYNSQNTTIAGGGATSQTVSTSSSGNTVNTKTLTITGLSAADKTYDQNTTVSVTGTPAYSGLANSESFSVTGSVTWAFPNATAGLKTLTRTGNYDAPSSNYTVTQPVLTATIIQKALTVPDAAAVSRPYNATTAATITGTLSGVISPDVVSFNGTGTFAQANAGTAIAVTSTSSITGADAANYLLSQPVGLSADIQQATQSITFPALAVRTSSDTSFTLTLNASSGLPITYTSSNTAVATVAGNKVTIVGVGSSIITASQAGNANYTAATSVQQTLTVITTIAKWTFEPVATISNTGISPSLSSTVADVGVQTTGSVASGLHASSATAWSSPAGNGSAKSLSANTWGVNDYFQFVLNTTGYNDLLVSFDQTGSGTGPKNFKLQYSTDGSTFTDFSSYGVPSSGTTPISWSTTTPNFNSNLSFDLSLVSEIDNKAAVYFRVVQTNTTSIGGGTVGTGGTSRIDNFSVSGTPIIPNTVLGAYPSQLSSNVVKGNVNIPLAGFNVTADAGLNFTGVTVNGSIATNADASNLRIYRDNNGNGQIDGADASVSGAGIAFGSTMNFTISSQPLTANVANNYLIVADLDFNGTSPDITVGISSANFTTSTGTKSGSMANVTRTIESPVGASTITAGPGPLPATISSLVNTSGAASLNFDFTVTDDGATPSTDAEPTEIYSITLTQGSGNDVANWTQLIDGAQLSDGTETATAVVNSGNLFFDLSGWSSGAAIIDDDASSTFTLKVWLKSSLGALQTTIDGANLVFKIDPSTIDFAGSGFAPAQELSSGATNNAVEVTATALAYVQQPSNGGINVAMTPAVTVQAVDANGNRDLGFTSQVRITSSGSLSGTPVDAAAVSGLATFNSLIHSSGGTGLTLTARRAASLDWNVSSNTFNITLVTSATDHFRSNVSPSGNWNVAGNWESSPDSTNWITSTLVPASSAASISIQNGDSITITAAATIDQVYVRNGGVLRMNIAFTVNNGTGDDIIVQNGGTFIYNSGSTTPTFSTSATMRVNEGGKIRAQVSGISGAGAGINSSSIIYDNGSVLEWATTNTPSSSNVTFFPNAASGTIPVLRFVSNVTGWGATGTTTVNGRLEVNSGNSLTLSGSGVKTFRNGIDGAGTVNQSTAGRILISGTTASMGGGTLTLGSSGLTVANGSVVTLTSNKTIAGTGAVADTGTIIMNGFSLTAPSIVGTGDLSGSATSSLTVGGNSTLRFTSGGRTLKDLTVNGGTSTLVTPLTISGGTSTESAGTVTVASGASLVSDGNLNLQSNSFGTARVAAGSTSGNYITGNVTVERYVPVFNSGFTPSHMKAWRMLSVPTYVSGGRSIRSAWQEGGVTNNGFGTLISGTPSNATALGFDIQSFNFSSMQSYNGSAWVSVPNTISYLLDTTGSYFIFIRGNRTVGASTAVTDNSKDAVLRTTGNLYQGNGIPGAGLSSSFTAAGNIYASAINFVQLQANNSARINEVFYLWDARRRSGTSLGGYQTFSATNGYACTPGGGSFTAGQVNTTIQSGQGFFVSPKAPGTGQKLVFDENIKVSGSNNNAFRPVIPSDRIVKIDTRLLDAANGEVADGNTVVFSDRYANAVDEHDASKLRNSTENFGIARGDKLLAVEGRQPVADGDEVVFAISNLREKNYLVEVNASQLREPGLEAVLEDSYTNLRTPLDLGGTTLVPVAINADINSKAANRFRIVFSSKPVAGGKSGFTVSPNPVSEGVINFRLSNQQAGRYQVRMLNAEGKAMLVQVIEHAGGSAARQLTLPGKTAAGIYTLELTGPDASRQTLQVLVSE